MLQLDPNDSKELAFALHKAVRLSGLTLGEIAERLKQDYDVKAAPSSLSHVIHRGSIRLQRALQILNRALRHNNWGQPLASLCQTPKKVPANKTAFGKYHCHRRRRE